MKSLFFICFFFFKQKTAYEIMPSLVGSEMCIRDRVRGRGPDAGPALADRGGHARTLPRRAGGLRTLSRRYRRWPDDGRDGGPAGASRGAARRALERVGPRATAARRRPMRTYSGSCALSLIHI